MALTQLKTGAIADDAVTTDKLANAINTERTANTAKSTNATHTGEVTGSGALTITDDTVDEANLKISNAGSNGQFLQKQSGDTGGLTWATPTDTNTVTTINNNADNRVITGSGTANTLEGESGLTFDATTLKVSGASNTTQAVFAGTGGSGARGLAISTETVGAADEGVILNAQASGTTGRIKLQTNGATAMTILGNGGNVGIGTTSPGAKLQVNDTNPVIAEFYRSDGGTNDEARISLGAYSSNPPSQRGVNLIALNNGAGHDFLVNTSSSHSGGPSEKLRVLSSGELCVGRTNATINSANFGTSIGGGGLYVSRDVTGASHPFAAYGNQGVAYIMGDGDLLNTNGSYGSVSDETLKQDIVDAASQWDDIKNIRVRKFRFKDNPKGPLQIGVVAQEIEKVSAGLVSDRYLDGKADSGEKVKSVKYSVLHMKAVKALQEAMARIETLEAKVAALEAG